MQHWKSVAAVTFGLVFAAPVAFADDISLEQLPQPVRDTLDSELSQAEIGEIERDTDGGQTVYEIEFRENQQKYELDVAEDGRVLRRHAD